LACFPQLNVKTKSKRNLKNKPSTIHLISSKSQNLQQTSKTAVKKKIRVETKVFFLADLLLNLQINYWLLLLTRNLFKLDVTFQVCTLTLFNIMIFIKNHLSVHLILWLRGISIKYNKIQGQKFAWTLPCLAANS